MADDSPPAQAVPPWLNPNNVPPWVYLVAMLLGGGGLTGLNLYDGDAKDADIVRLEQQVAVVERKVDDLAELMTEIRIGIATYHAGDGD